jgi:hypothetical protein
VIHDEKTTELELPKKTQTDASATVASAIVVPDSVPVVSRQPVSSNRESIRDLDWNSPWVLRLIAVIAILVLSMIIL